MEDIFEKIIDIEMKAQSVIKEAEDNRKNLDKTIDEEIAKIKKEIEKKASDKCENVKDFEDNDADEKIAEVEEKKREILKKLENIYQENREKWIGDILDEIINS